MITSFHYMSLFLLKPVSSLMLAAFFFSLFLSGQTSKPNFIIIIGDDVGWDAFGCTGMEEARTPAIDQLADESTMMTRFYCSVSQCAPLRAELYTGLFPMNNGVLANAKKEKRMGIKNIADHLNPAGIQGWVVWKETLWFGRRQDRCDPRISLQCEWIEPDTFIRWSRRLYFPGKEGRKLVLRGYWGDPRPPSLGSWK
jgi:hypothetical protein